MIADIEDGKVDTVVIKDLSRLGRNNAMTAFYSEIFFPDHDTG
jgi:DNA invertase Pin-like site-specific DNA recombinase